MRAWVTDEWIIHVMECAKVKHTHRGKGQGEGRQQQGQRVRITQVGSAPTQQRTDFPFFSLKDLNLRLDFKKKSTSKFNDKRCQFHQEGDNFSNPVGILMKTKCGTCYRKIWKPQREKHRVDDQQWICSKQTRDNVWKTVVIKSK